MKLFSYDKLTRSALNALVQRPSGNMNDIMPQVAAIVGEVCAEGDAALRRFTKKFDGVEVRQFKVEEEKFKDVNLKVDAATTEAIADAARAIEAFHLPQVPRTIEVETSPGVVCRREWRSIQRVGLYIPGGSAPLISTVLMLGIPARLAHCQEVSLCTPPSRNGSVLPEILLAAQITGIRNVYAIGGAQAIGALAAGTESIPKVDKIFGPGNRYVAAAKSVVSQPPYNVAVDAIAGPTELMVIADDSANPCWVTADLLSQAEHGADSQVVLVTTSEAFAEKVEKEIAGQVTDLPRREVIQQSMEQSFALVVQNMDQALIFANEYSPEHLIIAVRDAETIAPNVVNAGSVFLGGRSSVVFGDYASGTNHTLPTNCTARSTGGVTVECFMKPVFFQTVNAQGSASLAPTVKSLARAEHLEAHARAVELRKNP